MVSYRGFARALVLALVCGASAAQPLRDAAGHDVGALVRPLAGSDAAFVLLDVNSGAGTGDGLFRADFEVGEVPASAQVSQGGLVEAIVSPEGIVHPYSPYVLFDGAACSGNALLSASATKLAAYTRAAIVGANLDVYVAASAGVERLSVASVLGASGCRRYEHKVDVLRARQLGSLASQLVLPLSWN